MKMIPLPVKAYPPERTYRSAAAAITGAKNHPLQLEAQAVTRQLEGTRIVGGAWTLGDFVINLSNGLWLHIFIKDGHVGWSLGENRPQLQGSKRETVGSPPVWLDWGGEIGCCTMDRSGLLARRIGAEFRLLFVNEGGIVVYTKHQKMVLLFHPLFRTDSREDILYVTEDDWSAG
jgi:hypothetical protein